MSHCTGPLVWWEIAKDSHTSHYDHNIITIPQYHNTTFLIHEDDNEDHWGPKLGQFWPQTENILLKIKLPASPITKATERIWPSTGKWQKCIFWTNQLPFRWWLIHVWPAFWLFDQLVRFGSSIYMECTTATPNPCKSFAFRLCCALMWTNLFCTPLMEHSSWVLVADLIIRVRLNLGQNIELTLYIKHSKIVSAEALKRPVLLCCQVFYGFENWIHYRWTNQAP